jgi:hypothetical protein
MVWDYGHKAWFSSMASGQRLGLRSDNLVLEYGLRAWFGIGITQPGLGLRSQGMVWDYGHTSERIWSVTSRLGASKGTGLFYSL